MSQKRKKIIRVSTVPLSLKMFCKDLLVEISDTYDVLAVSSPGAELDELAALGIPVEPVRMAREISPVSDLLSLWSLIRLFRRQRPDIVHSVTPKAGLLSMIAAWVSGVPYRVHSFTGLLFPTATGLKQRVLKLTDSITCACATHILPEGQGVKDDLRRARITSKPLRVLGHGNVRGVDMDHYQRTEQVMAEAREIRRRYGIADADFTFVFVGRVVKDKGMAELAEAFARLASGRGNHKVHLLLAGAQEPATDPLTPETLRLLQTTEGVHLTDTWIEDVRPYYAAADALVFPSYREGFPNVVLEAGAMSLPSIVTDINGSREIVADGVNGNIIPAKDTEALYGMMSRYAAEPGLVARLSEHCRGIIEAKYEARYVRKCLKDFYGELQQQ